MAAVVHVQLFYGYTLRLTLSHPKRILRTRSTENFAHQIALYPFRPIRFVPHMSVELLRMMCRPSLSIRIAVPWLRSLCTVQPQLKRARFSGIIHFTADSRLISPTNVWYSHKLYSNTFCSAVSRTPCTLYVHLCHPHPSFRSIK